MEIKLLFSKIYNLFTRKNTDNSQDPFLLNLLKEYESLDQIDLINQQNSIQTPIN